MRLVMRVLVLVGLFSLGQAVAAQTRLTCESRDNQPNFCAAETSGGVRLVRQLSSARCAEGQTWGYDRRGIWVNRGCRGEFEMRAGLGAGRGELITCSSENHRRQVCPADTRGGVRLVRRISDAECRQGSSWGYDSRSIWVDRGCRAEFEVASGWRWGGRSGGGGIGEVQTLTCESRDNRRRACPADTRGAVRLIRQLSRLRCIQNQTWGTDSRGIWVDRGCRAEFEITGRDDRRDDRRDFPGRGRGAGRALTQAETSCANEVATRMRVAANRVETEIATQGGVGTQLIEWRAPNGTTGYCRVNSNGRIVQFRQD